MAYDILIWALTVSGILTVVVFSVKIARSGVYPVGIVKKLPASKELLSKAELVRQEIAALRRESLKGIYRIGGTSPTGRVYYAYVGQSKYLRLREVQLAGWKERVLEQNPIEQEERTAELEKKSAEQDRTLKHLEKRLRQLEIKSLQESQDAAKETDQPPQEEYIH